VQGNTNRKQHNRVNGITEKADPNFAYIFLSGTPCAEKVYINQPNCA
jgi:hypothetical protein